MMRSFARLGLVVFVVAAALAGVGRGAPGAEAAGPGTWTFAASLPISVDQHTATLLRNGDVLVAGGARNGSIWSDDVFVYDRGSNAWSTAPVMQRARVLHAATLLRDGRILVSGGGLSEGTAETRDPLTGDWTYTAPMVVDRYGHTQTLLNDGRVLVTGGYSPSDQAITYTASAEIFDPASNTWTAAAPMDVPLYEHHAALLPDGRVIVGGLGYAMLYDPATDSWSPTSATSFLPTGLVALGDGHVVMYGYDGFDAAIAVYDAIADTWQIAPYSGFNSRPTMSVLGNGHVLMTGGWAGSLTTTTLEIDPDTLTVAERPGMQNARAEHTATVLTGGEVLVVGGIGPTAELWDPTSWQPVAPMLEPRSSHTLTLLQDGRAIAMGGYGMSDSQDSTEVFNPATGDWTASGTMPWPHDSHEATVMRNGKVLVTGSPLLSDQKTVWHPATGSFTVTTDLCCDREGSTATLLMDGRVLILGGPTTSIPEVYDPTTDTVTQTAPAPDSRRYHRAVLLNDGRVLVVGGFKFVPPATTVPLDPWVYSPTTDTWAVVPGAHPTTHAEIGIALLPNGDVLVAGGTTFDPTVMTDQVSIFDPDSNSWSAGPTLPAPAAGDAVTLYSGDVLFANGDGNKLYDFQTSTWSDAGLAFPSYPYVTALVRLPSGQVLLAGGADDVNGTLPSATLYDLGIHTDTDGDGYHDGVELALSQHPWSYCATMRADVNMDGNVNSIDQLKMAQNYFSRPPQERVDQDGNLRINSIDQLKLGQQIAKSVLMCP